MSFVEMIAVWIGDRVFFRADQVRALLIQLKML
jgi:hypothetical protein